MQKTIQIKAIPFVRRVLKAAGLLREDGRVVEGKISVTPVFKKYKIAIGGK